MSELQITLENAEEALASALQTVRALHAFVASNAMDISALASATVLVEDEVDRELLAGSRAEADPLLAAASSSAPYCPFCQTPTCRCWEEHVCR